jgi:hypothetical protein
VAWISAVRAAPTPTTARHSGPGTDEADLVGEDDGLDAAADAELEEDALDVRLDGGLADVEPLGQLGVVLPARLLAGDGPAKV